MDITPHLRMRILRTAFEIHAQINMDAHLRTAKSVHVFGRRRYGECSPGSLFQARPDLKYIALQFWMERLGSKLKSNTRSSARRQSSWIKLGAQRSRRSNSRSVRGWLSGCSCSAEENWQRIQTINPVQLYRNVFGFLKSGRVLFG